MQAAFGRYLCTMVGAVIDDVKENILNSIKKSITLRIEVFNNA